MKNVLITILLLALIALTIFYKDEITNYILINYFGKPDETQYKSIVNNEYARNYNYAYASLTSDFIVNSKKEIINVIYTFLNSGMDKFIFICADDYSLCSKEVESITGDDEILSTLNNYVHPFNGYKRIYTKINSNGEITLEIDKAYTNEEINNINAEIDRITNIIITDDMTNNQKIKSFHDYLINNISYDKEKENNPDLKNESHKATGALFIKKAICSGYTDTMAIILNKLMINNYRISNDNHIWNLVQIEDTYLHLDLTWDDPITNDGKNYLLHEFFLISTKRLEEINTGKHIYNKEIYKEAI